MISVTRITPKNTTKITSDRKCFLVNRYINRGYFMNCPLVFINNFKELLKGYKTW